MPSIKCPLRSRLRPFKPRGITTCCRTKTSDHFILFFISNDMLMTVCCGLLLLRFYILREKWRICSGKRVRCRSYHTRHATPQPPPTPALPPSPLPSLTLLLILLDAEIGWMDEIPGQIDTLCSAEWDKKTPTYTHGQLTLLSQRAAQVTGH